MTDAGKGKEAAADLAEWGEEDEPSDWGGDWKQQEVEGFDEEEEYEAGATGSPEKKRGVTVSEEAARQRMEGMVADSQLKAAIWSVGDDILTQAMSHLTVAEYRDFVRTSTRAKSVRRAANEVVIDYGWRHVFSSKPHDVLIKPHAPFAEALRLHQVLDCIRPAHLQLWQQHPWCGLCPHYPRIHLFFGRKKLQTLEINSWEAPTAKHLFECMDVLLPPPGSPFRNFLLRAPGMRAPEVRGMPSREDMTSLVLERLAAKKLKGPTGWLALMAVSNRTLETLHRYLKSLDEKHRPTKLELHVYDVSDVGRVIEPCGPRLTALRLEWDGAVHADRITRVLEDGKLGSSLVELQCHGTLVGMSQAELSLWQQQCPNVSVFAAQWVARPSDNYTFQPWPLVRLRANAIHGNFPRMEKVSIVDPIDLTALKTPLEHKSLRSASLEMYVKAQQWTTLASFQVPWRELVLRTSSSAPGPEGAQALATLLHDHCSTLQRFEVPFLSWETLANVAESARPTHTLRHLRIGTSTDKGDAKMAAEARAIPALVGWAPRLETFGRQMCDAQHVVYLFEMLPRLRLADIQILTGATKELVKWGLDHLESPRRWAVATPRNTMYLHMSMAEWQSLIALYPSEDDGLHLRLWNYDHRMWKGLAAQTALGLFL
jgi:hypothetical protein